MPGTWLCLIFKISKIGKILVSQNLSLKPSCPGFSASSLIKGKKQAITVFKNFHYVISI